jgi:hypothetical protein
MVLFLFVVRNQLIKLSFKKTNRTWEIQIIIFYVPTIVIKMQGRSLRRQGGGQLQSPLGFAKNYQNI